MKKIVILTFLLILSAAIFLILPVQAEDQNTATIGVDKMIMNAGPLEKISSPDQIKYFRIIKKENGVLYGVRRTQAENDKKSEKSEKKEVGNAGDNNTSASSTKARLEKILAPQFVALYEKIQKIGNSLWGVKKENQENNKQKSDKVEPKYRPVTAEMITCVSTAIDKKDVALKNRLALVDTSIAAAITARGECQKKAIQTIENQRENLNICVKDFQVKHQETIKEAKNDQQLIWKNYQAEMKACGAQGAETSSSLELMSEDGGAAVLDTILTQ